MIRMPTRFEIVSDISSLSSTAAGIVLQSARQAISERGRFSIALSGGSTPRALYALLAQPPWLDLIDWGRVDIFWGDERCVPPNHPDSDYGMARSELLERLPPENKLSIHRLEGELEPDEAAQRYEKVLKTYFGLAPAASFDLLLLGLGEDGHTASLFPHTQPINETRKWVRAHFVAQLSSFRLTLTPPILNLSRTVLFLVAGKKKAAVLAKVIYGERDIDQLPAQVIRTASDDIIWLVDQDAASELPEGA
jgi:6-phosphogluconolactonase